MLRQKLGPDGRVKAIEYNDQASIGPGKETQLCILAYRITP